MASIIESNPDLDPSRLVPRRFDVLWSEYSAGRDLGEIRSDFVEVVEAWTPPSEFDTNTRALEVGVWLRAFGLEAYLPAWRQVYESSGTSLFTRWVLGDAEAVFRADRPRERKIVVDTNDLTRRALADPEAVQEDVEDYVMRRWYRGNSWDWWWNLHNDEDLLETGNYLGYWCWEAAAIVLMAGVDDSHLRDAKYYPYDLVHYLDN